MTKKTVGIIAAPNFSTEVANDLQEILPKLLKEEFKADVSWEIEVLTDGLTSVAEDHEQLLDGVLMRQQNKDWDYTLCLTDVPIFFKNDVTLARINFDYNTAFLSLPAFGWFVKKRLIHMVLRAIEDIHYQTSDFNVDDRKKRTNKIFYLNNINKYSTSEEDKRITRYVFSPRMNGYLTLLSGMIYDNQPWTILPSLKSVIAVAFGSGAYGMIFPTLWQIGFDYSPLRLGILMVWAIILLGFWIIQGHNLLEVKTPSRDNRYRTLYNITTILTMFLAVAFFYIILFLLFLATVVIFVDPQLYITQLNLAGTPTLMNYIQLAWITASVGTLTGAIGVGLEDEKNVRQKTYGYRQLERYYATEEAKEDDDSSTK